MWDPKVILGGMLVMMIANASCQIKTDCLKWQDVCRDGEPKPHIIPQSIPPPLPDQPKPKPKIPSGTRQYLVRR